MDTALNRILLATDGSEDAALAARAAIDLSNGTGAELHVVHVWTNVPSVRFSSFVATELERAGQELLDGQVEEIERAGGTVARAHLREGRTADEIADLAAELGADLVAMGSRGMGTVKRLVVGSASEKVMSLAPCPVLLLRGGEGAWPPSRLVVGDDSSEEARRGGELAAAIGRLFSAEALLVRVHHPQQLVGVTRKVSDLEAVEEFRRTVEEALEERAAGLHETLGRRPQTRVATGDAAAVLQEVAEEGEGPALVAVGSRGLGAAGRFALGSVSSDVLRSVSGPVLVVPPAKEQSAMGPADDRSGEG